MNKEIYRFIRIAGVFSFIPFVLLAGPLGGYILASYLAGKFNLPGYLISIIIGIGFLVSFFETARIIRMIYKSEGRK